MAARGKKDKLLKTRPVGRPSLYNKELGQTICARIAGGLGLKAISRHKGMPAFQTILRWVGQHQEFRDNYIRAGEARGIYRAEQIAVIITKMLSGEITPEAARVAIQGLEWLASREARKVYGDSIALTGADGGDIRISHVRDEIDRKLAGLVAVNDEDGVPRITNGSGTSRAQA